MLVRPRLDEELEFHLLEFAHAEDEVPGRDLVAERLPDLGDAERRAARGRVEHVLEVGEDRLRRLGSEIGERGAVVHGADSGLEHQVERTRLGQVVGAAFRTAAINMVGAPARLACAAVHERIGESILMAGVVQDVAVCQDGGIQPFDVVALIDHGAPPGGLQGCS